MPDGDALKELDGFFFESDELGACIAVNVLPGDTTGFRATFTAADRADEEARKRAAADDPAPRRSSGRPGGATVRRTHLHH